MRDMKSELISHSKMHLSSESVNEHTGVMSFYSPLVSYLKFNVFFLNNFIIHNQWHKMNKLDKAKLTNYGSHNTTFFVIDLCLYILCMDFCFRLMCHHSAYLTRS